MDMKTRFWGREEPMLSYSAILKPVGKDIIKKIELKASLIVGELQNCLRHFVKRYRKSPLFFAFSPSQLSLFFLFKRPGYREI
jgi:hypothetical protein